MTISGYLDSKGRTTYAAIFENTAFKASDLQKINSQLFNYVAAARIPSLSLAIAKDGKLVYARAFGWADIENRLIAGPRHRYRVASVSKPITAWRP